MRILSYNIRGLGSVVKKKEIRRLSVNIKLTSAVFKNVSSNLFMNWIAEHYVIFWLGFRSFYRKIRRHYIHLDSCLNSWFFNGARVVIGEWGLQKIPCCIINVYTPSLLSEKLVLWDNSFCYQS